MLRRQKKKRASGDLRRQIGGRAAWTPPGRQADANPRGDAREGGTDAARSFSLPSNPHSSRMAQRERDQADRTRPKNAFCISP